MLNKNSPIIIVANCFWYVYNFGLDLIKILKASCHKIIIIAPSDSYNNLVKDYCFIFYL